MDNYICYRLRYSALPRQSDHSVPKCPFLVDVVKVIPYSLVLRSVPDHRHPLDLQLVWPEISVCYILLFSCAYFTFPAQFVSFHYAFLEYSDITAESRHSSARKCINCLATVGKHAHAPTIHFASLDSSPHNMSLSNS
jgi:hypothetical protein